MGLCWELSGWLPAGLTAAAMSGWWLAVVLAVVVAGSDERWLCSVLRTVVSQRAVFLKQLWAVPWPPCVQALSGSLLGPFLGRRRWCKGTNGGL